MSDTQVLVVDGREDLQTLLEQHGIDLGGRTAIPLCIPINSLDDIPTVLKNLGVNADKIAAQMSAELRGDDEELDALRERNRKLEEANTILQAKLDGVANALGIEL